MLPIGDDEGQAGDARIVTIRLIGPNVLAFKLFATRPQLATA